MSVQILGTDELPDGAADLVAAAADKTPRALRTLAVTAVCLGVAALAAATFVLSYSAIRAVVLQAGITPRLARGYPLLLDAMLIIVLAAVLALRGAGLGSRLLAWVTLLLVMTAAAGADAMHSAGRSMPHQAAAITTAVLPFALVLVAFALLLAMLRHARLRRLADAEAAAAMRAVMVRAAVTPMQRGSADAHLAIAHPADPDHGLSEPATGATPYPVDALADGWYVDDAAAADGSDEPRHVGPLLTTEASSETDFATVDEDGPVFHRLFSAPTLAPEGPLTEETPAEETPAEGAAAEMLAGEEVAGEEVVGEEVAGEHGTAED